MTGPGSPAPRADGRVLRLLPWRHDGKPAVLVTDGTETYLSRLADRIERQQIETAVLVLDLAGPMVEDDADVSAPELRWAARRLMECLSDVLGICDSRGHRLPAYEPGDEGGGRTGDE